MLKHQKVSKYYESGCRSRHGHKYSKEKKCLDMMMFIYIKQPLSNIWSSIQEKVKQHWGSEDELKKSVAYKKRCVRTMDKRSFHNFTFFIRLPLFSIFYFDLVKYSENLNSDPGFQSFHTDIDITSCILIIIFNN